MNERQQIGALSISLGTLLVIGGVAIIAMQLPGMRVAQTILAGLVAVLIGVYCITHSIAYLKGEESQLNWILAAWIFALCVTLVAVDMLLLQIILVFATGYIIYSILQLMQEN